MTNPERQTEDLSRRHLLKTAAGVAAAGVVGLSTANAAEADGRVVKKGRIKQSVCGWCYRGKLTLAELAAASAKMGLVGIDLVAPKDFPLLKKYGLIGTMTPSHGITKGVNDPANHEMCLEAIRTGIEATAEAGWKNVICFSGNRGNIDDKTGLKNCVAALKQIIPLAEEKNVTINMELLNSRVDHKDYMCDRTEWGVELVKRVASDRFRLLYDIYHMQIMEGDIIRTIQNNHQYLGHYHTAGNPGRHELDESQELYYPPIVQAIVESGYDGYLGQEFIPTRNAVTSLAEAVALCDV